MMAFACDAVYPLLLRALVPVEAYSESDTRWDYVPSLTCKMFLRPMELAVLQHL